MDCDLGKCVKIKVRVNEKMMGFIN